MFPSWIPHLSATLHVMHSPSSKQVLNWKWRYHVQWTLGVNLTKVAVVCYIKVPCRKAVFFSSFRPVLSVLSLFVFGHVNNNALSNFTVLSPHFVQKNDNHFAGNAEPHLSTWFTSYKHCGWILDCKSNSIAERGDISHLPNPKIPAQRIRGQGQAKWKKPSCLET